MLALTIALWVIAFEGLLAIVFMLVFLVNMKRDLTKTLENTQSLLKTLETKISLISDELDNTLKNTTEITSQAKKSVKKVDTVLTILGGVGILLPLLSLSRKDSEKGYKLSKLASLGSFLFAVRRGFNLYRQYARKEGK